jgi:hypothetical protein
MRNWIWIGTKMRSWMGRRSRERRSEMCIIDGGMNGVTDNG